MKTVLENGTADKILACGVTGVIMLLAQGKKIGARYEQFLKDKDLLVFVEPAREMLLDFPGRIEIPSDLAYAVNGHRFETGLDALPMDDQLFLDIGPDTMARFAAIIQTAGTIFVNGPAGVYEDVLFEAGTKVLWQAIADAPGYSVIGGGDTVSAATRFIDLAKINYVCTAGGAMVRFLSGKTLPLVEAMEKAYERDKK
jgi:phosphoglycerate kinase